MNENDYVRKDVHEAQQDHILDLIDALDKRIDDQRDSVNRIITFGGVFLSAITVILSLIFYFLR